MIFLLAISFFANFQENIPNLANNYEPLKNLNFAHTQQTFYKVYS